MEQYHIYAIFQNGRRYFRNFYHLEPAIADYNRLEQLEGVIKVILKERRGNNMYDVQVSEIQGRYNKMKRIMTYENY